MTKKQLQAAVDKRKAELNKQSEQLADIKSVITELIAKIDNNSIAKKLLKDLTDRLRALLRLEENNVN